MSWKTLGTVEPNKLPAARLELHWAAQLLSAVGTSLLEPADDFSHTNLQWLDGEGVLAGRPVGAHGLRAGLRFEALDLLLVDPDGETQKYGLCGRTITDGLEWLAAEFEVEPSKLQRPEHELPDAPMAHGKPFDDAGIAERAELAHWFDNAAQLIPEVAPSGASELVCWPHHFDLATLIVLDPDIDAESARSVGIGLSPGDGTFDHPYFYVTPWPYPEASVLPKLVNGGRWHTEGFTAVIVSSEDLLEGETDSQRDRLNGALTEAVERAHEVLAT